MHIKSRMGRLIVIFCSLEEQMMSKRKWRKSPRTTEKQQTTKHLVEKVKNLLGIYNHMIQLRRSVQCTKVYMHDYR